MYVCPCSHVSEAVFEMSLRDQELLLQLAFAQLDVGRKGGITMDEIGQISNNVHIHSFLKYTVFWSFIKKRQWSFFTAMFEGSANTTSQSSNQRKNFITYKGIYMYVCMNVLFCI